MSKEKKIGSAIIMASTLMIVVVVSAAAIAINPPHAWGDPWSWGPVTPAQEYNFCHHYYKWYTYECSHNPGKR